MSAVIPILFEDDEIVAVEKPVGISIHNTEDSTNLIEVVEKQLGRKKIFPVHRLDKETSGVQIFGLDEHAARKYAEQFQFKTVKKIYVGVLRGLLGDRIDSDRRTGTWNLPLSDKSEGRVNPAGVARDRVACETRYEIVRCSRYFTMCDFDLITGRQHQIRKHAAIAGHTLVGDTRYGDSKYNRKIGSIYGESRMFLHCKSIELMGRKIQSETPASFAKLFVESRSTDNE